MYIFTPGSENSLPEVGEKPYQPLNDQFPRHEFWKLECCETFLSSSLVQKVAVGILTTSDIWLFTMPVFMLQNLVH